VVGKNKLRKISRFETNTRGTANINRKGKTKKIDIFHHKDDNINMNVVEKDAVVSGMLGDELSRCEEALASILKAFSELPKGSLGSRKKIYKDKEYKYHYLKFREGNKVISQHVPEGDLEKFRDKLALRKKYLLEAGAYKKRIAYLEGLLQD